LLGNQSVLKVKKLQIFNEETAATRKPFGTFEMIAQYKMTKHIHNYVRFELKFQD